MIVQRARRFSIQATVLYRRSGESHWDEGMTVNVSRSGMLFAAGTALPPGTSIEMVFWLSSDVLDTETTADVVCSGRVVRVERVPSGGSQLLAATIASYRFTRAQSDPQR